MPRKQKTAVKHKTSCYQSTSGLNGDIDRHFGEHEITLQTTGVDHHDHWHQLVKLTCTVEVVDHGV